MRCWMRVRYSSVVSCLGMLVLLAFVPLVDADDSSLIRPGRLLFRLAADVPLIEDQEGKITCSIPSLQERFDRLHASRIERKYPFIKPPEDPAVPDLSRIYLLVFPENLDVRTATKVLEAHPAITWAEPDVICECFEVPNDTTYHVMQHLRQIDASEAWDIHHGEGGDSTILIGVVDTGIAWDHDDLAANMWNNLGEDIDGDGVTWYREGNGWSFDPDDVNGIDDDQNGFIDDFCGWNFYNAEGEEDNIADDVSITSHGTHVSGLSAGGTNNGFGIASISWNVNVVATSHSDYAGTSAYNTFDGVVYMINLGVDIINCSWGSSMYLRGGEEIMQYAASQGIVVVAAAGNSASDTPSYPACYPCVVSVASVNYGNVMADYSSYGTLVDVSAPGGDHFADSGILSTAGTNSYSRMCGTSMASPVVAGLFGLLKSYHPDWEREELINQVLGTTEDISRLNPGMENQLGTGRINAFNCLDEENPSFERDVILHYNVIQPRMAGVHEPYENIYFSIELMELTHEIAPGNALLRISTADESIHLVDDTCAFVMPGEGTFILEDAFCLTVDEDADYHLARINLEIEADFPVVFDTETEIMFPAGAGDVFVFDGDPDGLNFSGQFITEFLESQGLDVVYAEIFPSTFRGFDAVFLSYGNYGLDGSTYSAFTPAMSLVVERYIENGGNVYLEGGCALGFDQRYNTDLLSLFGVRTVLFSNEYVPRNEIVGTAGTLGNGLYYLESNQVNLNWIDALAPDRNGAIAFNLAEYGPVAIQNEGDYGQHTFCMSVVLNALEGTGQNSRDHLLSRICEYFSLSLLNRPAIESDIRSGHAPVTIQFQDATISNEYYPVLDWAWDFTSDGDFDSYLENPEFTYTVPGEYSVTLQAANGTNTQSRVYQDYIRVFDGESALEFGEEWSAADIHMPGLDNLADELTFEAWISPASYGTQDSAGFAHIVETDGFSLFLHNRASSHYPARCLVAKLRFSDYNNYWICTPANSIHVWGWQHIAMMYDGDEGTVDLFINGEPQPVAYSMGNIGSELRIDEQQMVTIGNSSDHSNRFVGDMDAVRFWQVALDEATLLANSNHTLEGTEPDLAACFSLNEGSYDTIRDCSPNQYEGICTHTEWVFGTTFEYAGVEDSREELPQSFAFHAPYPNPFNQSANIRIDLPEAGQLSLVVYDVLGRKVATLHEKQVAAGYHTIHWNGLSDSGFPVASGMYFCRVHFVQHGVRDVSQVQRMILLR